MTGGPAAPSTAPTERPASEPSATGPAPEHDRVAVIRTRKLTKRYGTLTAVDRLDLDVYAGEVFGLLGPNGAGKTTTILMLLGLSEPTDGEASVMGLDPAWEPREVKRRVGSMPDAVGFYGGSSTRSASPTAPTTQSRPTRAGCASGSASPTPWSRRPTC